MAPQRQLLLVLFFIFFSFYGASTPPITAEIIGIGLNDPQASECPGGLLIAHSSSSEELELDLLNESGELATIISGQNYELIIKEVLEFREKVTNAVRFNGKTIELISTLDSWKRDVTNKFASSWMEHSETIILIIFQRLKHDFIPNSVLADYLSFFAENIVTANARSSIFKQILDKSAEILRKMIRNAISVDIIRFYLDKIFPYMCQEHAIQIFHSCHWLLDYFCGISGPTLKTCLYQVFQTYLTILRHFDLDVKDLNNLIRHFRSKSATIPFIDLSIFYRYLLMLPTVNQDFINSSVLTFHESVFDYIKVLNFFLKESEFTNNFAVDAETILRKRDIFQRVREIFFPTKDLLSILLYCLVNKFTVIYEAFLIYSEKNSELLETLFQVLKHATVKRIEDINVYALILAAWPGFTIALLDRLVSEFSKVPGNKLIPLNDFMLKSFRRLILVAGSIDSTTMTWNPSEDFLEYLQVEDFDPRQGHLFQAGRVYLQIRFGIPFSLTAISVFECDEEEATWREMIGFVNLILEREGRKAGSDPIPQIRSDFRDEKL